MAQNIKLKRSSVPGKVPTTAQLQAGEIAINTADGKLYFERDDTSIQTIVTTNALITGSLDIYGPVTATSFTGSFSGSVAAPGSNTQVVFNSGGFLAASSNFVFSGSSVGINRAIPTHALDISGSNLQIGSIVVGRGLTPNTSLVIGSGSLTTYTGSSSLTVYGNNALTNLTTGFSNDAFGDYALNLTTTGSYNTAFGQSAGRRNNGYSNVFIGQFSGPYYHTLTGGFNTFIGPLAGIFSSGSAAKNSGIGNAALYNLSDGIENTAIGSAALLDLTAGSGNIAFGFDTGRGIVTGNGNLIIGNKIQGLSSTLSNNIIIGDGQGNIKYRYADNNTTISGSLSIQGTTTVVQEGILVTGTTSLTVKSISTGSYEGAFLDYVLSSSTNKRAGTLTTVWTGANIEWKDVSTLDLGSTEGAEFTPTLAGSNANIVLAVPAGTWTVKGHLRYM